MSQVLYHTPTAARPFGATLSRAAAVHLPPIHNDPFDRLLVAQAWVEPMILLTDDDTLGGYGDFVEVV